MSELESLKLDKIGRNKSQTTTSDSLIFISLNCPYQLIASNKLILLWNRMKKPNQSLN